MVKHRVNKLKDMWGTKLECRAWAQHCCLGNSLPIYKGICIRAVRGHSYHTVSVHQVAVVRQNSRTQQLNINKGGYISTNSATHQLQQLHKVQLQCWSGEEPPTAFNRTLLKRLVRVLLYLHLQDLWEFSGEYEMSGLCDDSHVIVVAAPKIVNSSVPSAQLSSLMRES